MRVSGGRAVDDESAPREGKTPAPQDVVTDASEPTAQPRRTVDFNSLN
jgi:hypothetical protein